MKGTIKTYFSPGISVLLNAKRGSQILILLIASIPLSLK